MFSLLTARCSLLQIPTAHRKLRLRATLPNPTGHNKIAQKAAPLH
jgi:hypothetical protein